jgi:hypothetical protein
VLSGCTADGDTFAIDCAAAGESCGPYPDSLATLDGCITPCSHACDGSDAEDCIGNAAIRVDCTLIGAAGCSAGSCVPAPPVACDAALMGSDRCEGDVLVSCDGSGHEVRQDCGTQATRRRCFAGDMTNAAQCDVTGTQCFPGDSCSGTDAVFCQDGFIARVSCTALGFHGCSAGACTP